MTIEQQHAILDKTYKQLTDFCGKPPRGSVAPWWEASKEGAELMLRFGVEYGNIFPTSPVEFVSLRFMSSSSAFPQKNPSPDRMLNITYQKTIASPTTIACRTISVQETSGRKSTMTGIPRLG